MSKKELTERANELEAQLNQCIQRGDFESANIFSYQLRQVIIELYPNRK